jgi:hypothetical protein
MASFAWFREWHENPPPKLEKSSMRSILQSLLVLAVTFVYVAGPYPTIKLEHSHEACHSHGHPHTGDDHDHSHHSHDHGPIPSSEVPDSDEPDGDPNTHTHLVSLGTDAPFIAATHNAFLASSVGTFHPPAIPDLVPDGPCFPLFKPPQLG